MKNLKRITYLALLVLIISCQKEGHITYPEFYRNYNEIKEYVYSDEIELLISRFDSLSRSVPHVPSEYLFKMAAICADHNYCELSAQYLKKSFENGKEYVSPIETNNCRDQIAEVLKKEFDIHNKYFNFKYKVKIDSMLEVDQQSRSESDSETIRAIDSLNMISLLALIDEFGFPSEKLIGNRSAWNAFIILLHLDRDKNNEVFKPIIDRAYNKGELGPREYAWIVDRRRAWGDDELEPYYYHMPSDKFETFTLDQKNVINRRRDSIGLEPK